MYLLLVETVLAGYLIYKVAVWLVNRNSEYWPKRDVPLAITSEYTPWYNVLLGKTDLVDLDLFYYNKFPQAKYVGLMEFSTPGLLIRDLDLCKQIYIKDFDHFLDRRIFPTGDELSDKFLFNMTGHAWKDSRATMSPVFTTNKIRQMFPHMEKSISQFKKYVQLQKEKTGSDDIELRDIFGRYTMDVIAGAAFGIDSRCLTDDDSTFMKHGRNLQAFTTWRTVKTVIAIFLPKLFNLTGFTVFDNDCMEFFKAVIKKAIKMRRENRGKYLDFVAAFVDQADGKVKEEVTEKITENGLHDELDSYEKDALIKTTNKAGFDDAEITANSLGFFFGGFDTTETLMTLSAYHMAIDPKVQQKLKDEVDSVSEEYDGKITYDGIAKMNYLDWLVHEVLRMYPVATRTERKVTKEWKIPETDVILPVGMLVAMPIYGFHMDEKHFPEPKKFDPERFSPENKQKRHPYAWMPFGHGPRGCIGIRFALIEAKAAIAHLVKNFEVSPCEDTWVPLKLENAPGVIKPKRGLKVCIKARS